MPAGTQAEATAYERLIAAQAKHRETSALLDRRPTSDTLTAPIDTAEALKAARVRLGLSQVQLGEALGLDAPRISGMENGKPIDKRTDLAVRALLAMKP